MNKTCLKCEVEKNISEFQTRSDTGKKRNICQTCRLKQISNWQNINREQTRKNQRKYISKPYGRAVSLFNSAKKRAKNKNEEFRLSLSDVFEGISKGFCQRTGIEFDFDMDVRHEKRTTVNPYSPSIDKINPQGIYEPSNVQYVSCWYNIAKSQYSDDFFLSMCKRVVENSA